MSQSRGSVLDKLRRHPDPERSDDPHIRELLDALAQLEVAPAPAEQFRTELRAQLVAVTPRLVAEAADDAAEADVAAAPAGARKVGVAKHASHPRRSFARPLTVAASVVTVLALVLGGLTWLSQNALPGSALYGLKRASENVRLDLASNSTDAANDRLQFATTRVDEARRLLHQPQAAALGRGPQADGGLSAHTAKLVADTLASANTDVLSASRQLNKNALAQKSAAPLATMLSWAPGQLTRLQSLAAASPTSSLRSQATASWGIVNGALTRARAVQAVASCTCMSSAPTDRYGPVPCSVCPTGSRSTGPVTPGSTARTHTTSPASTHHGTHAHATRHTGTHGTTGQGSPTPAPSSPRTHHPGTPTLPLPLPTPTLPITINSCGVTISVGPIGVHVSSCPTPHK